MRKLHLNFHGYWLDANRHRLPRVCGVFCVYACDYFAREETVAPARLLYIGDAMSARDRITSHPRRVDWLKLADEGETLCYSFAPAIIERKRVAAALILKHKPRENFLLPRDLIPPTEVLLSGKIALMYSSFAAGSVIRGSVGRPYHIGLDARGLSRLEAIR